MKCHSTQVPAGGKQSPRGRRLLGLRALSFVFLMIVAVSSAWGTDPVPSPEPGAEVLVLKPVLELHQGGGPVIIDGQVADSDDYPVSFLLATDQGKCTWFLIGARTLMTAAHCVSDGASIRIETKEQTTAYEGRCERAPNYPGDPSQDWALCLLSTEYPPPIVLGKPLTGYEVLNTDPSALQIGQRIQITGFGCDRQDGPLDGIYRVGWAKIEGLPPGVHIPGISGRTPNVLRLRKQPSQLCGGDSGGPAFEIVGKSPLFRRVIGINAQTSYTMGLGYGYLASTSTKAALDFFKKWAEAHDGQKICGLHKDAENCRPTKP